jgi:hypothetical protein
MISAAPSTAATAELEGAPSGLTLTARIMNGGVLVQSIANPAITYDDGYTASFTAPATTGRMTLEWLDGVTVVGAETLVVQASGGIVGAGVSALTRVLIHSLPTIAATFDVDGTATDPSPATATVTVTRDDGTILASGVSATRTGVGAFSYPLTQTTLLDILTVEWTSSLGTIATVVEVVGGFLFSIAQARALSPLSNTATYTTAKLLEARTMVETALEDACGVAFVPRYAKTTVNGSGTSTLLLPPRVRSIRSASNEGVAVSAPYLATMRLLSTGELYYPSLWASGFANYELAYEWGYDYPPPRVSQAALLWAKSWLVKGPIDDRWTSMTSEDGTYALSTPGMRGANSGLPEVDQVIHEYSLRAGVL